MSNGERFKAGKPDAIMKKLPMEDNTRIVALAGGFENGVLKSISSYYFLLDERICIAEQDRLEQEADLALNTIPVQDNFINDINEDDDEEE